MLNSFPKNFPPVCLIGTIRVLGTQEYIKFTKYVPFSDDSLTIYDGGSNTSPLLGEFCGDDVPPAQISSGNQIYLHFETNDWDSSSGFRLEYAPHSK